MFTPVIFTLALVAGAALSAPLPTQPRLAPLKRSTNSTNYIVSFHPNTVNPSNRAQWLSRILSEGGVDQIRSKSTADAAVLHWDENVFNGMAGTFEDDALDILRSQSEVALVEEDVILTKSTAVRQTNSPWGIARMSTGENPIELGRNARFNPLETTFAFTFDDSAGLDVDVYILDSGIKISHKDFGGRAQFLESFGDGVAGDDRDGHGTHVAGTAAGGFFGLAKRSNIFAVKVLNDQGAGPVSDIISGLNLVAQRHTTQSPKLPSVINMSLGGSGNVRSLDDATRNVIAQGVVVVVAAGNEGVNVGDSSPAGVDEAITVGATDIEDTMASFSNFGSVVDVLAPGQDIVSCGIQSNTDTEVLSGTSMSTPHVAGLAAVLLSQDPTLTPAQVATKIKQLAVRDVIRGVPRGTDNLLAFNGL